MEFKELLKKEFIILDGAMGTMLQASGLELGGIPEELNFTDPGLLTDIHRKYIEAGSDIVYTNTFGANRYKLAHSRYSVEEVIKKGVENARAACEGTDALVALDLGPIGKMLEPIGDLSFDEAYEYYKEEVIAGCDADLVVLETMTDLLEVKAALLAVKENSDKPVICTMTFEENMRTFTGVAVSSMAVTLEGLGADAIGMNCSLGPKEVFPIVKELAKWVSVPIVVKPNAGLPDPITNTYDVTPEDFAGLMGELVPLGVKIMGGCCGTNPEYIAALKARLSKEQYVKNEVRKFSAVCSATKTVLVDGPCIVGERINPTGKKRFKQALVDHDLDYILKQGIDQVEGGAEILDVNVGLPGIDEEMMMMEVIKELQTVVDVPLQIDSTIPKVLETALRHYNGKPLLNSVNGEQASMDAIFPLVKKYGAAVVALALDENGIPKKADERVAIARKIVKEAAKYGIPPRDIYVDCLTLTVSAQQEDAMETIKALHQVKEELGVKSALGVSNISFGLPNRELMNQNFLAMALLSGLDLPIINPNVPGMTGAVRSYRVLANLDKDSREYIDAYSNIEIKSMAATKENGQSQTDASVKVGQSLTDQLSNAIYKGLKEEGHDLTGEILKEMDPMVLVNEILIPALDEVGKKFEKGTMFLPQLILSAEVAKEAFSVIKTYLSKAEQAPVSKGNIVLATVKGDVHDIGKNIVKVLLENYGYTVIDLGKDVPPESVVKAAIEHKAPLVGLSALMTTTLVSMKETVDLLRENNVPCKVVVGGAVLTPEYAKEIGADFYAKDAKESVDAARQVFGS